MDRTEKLNNWKKIDIDRLIKKIDYEEINKLSTLSDHGTSIYVWSDGEISTLGQGSTPNTDEWYAVLPAQGRGNIDESFYADGWAVALDDDDPAIPEDADPYERYYQEEETGDIMTADEMIIKCIEEGEWSDYYNDFENEIRRQYDEDIRNLEDIIITNRQ